jgi:hypothetical protein
MMSLTEGEMLTNLRMKNRSFNRAVFTEHCYDSAEREFHSKILNDENCAHD